MGVAILCVETGSMPRLYTKKHSLSATNCKRLWEVWKLRISKPSGIHSHTYRVEENVRCQSMASWSFLFEYSTGDFQRRFLNTPFRVKGVYVTEDTNLASTRTKSNFLLQSATVLPKWSWMFEEKRTENNMPTLQRHEKSWRYITCIPIITDRRFLIQN
jgi:hypothetical protein